MAISLGNLVNVRDYSNLVVSNDWVPAIAGAVAEAVSSGRRGIWFPANASNYTVTKPATPAHSPSINLKGISDFIVAGDGPGSRLRMIGSGGGGSWNLIEIGGDSTNVTIRDLYLDGNYRNHNSGAWDQITNLDPGQHTHTIQIAGTIQGGYAHQVNIVNCVMTDMDGDGIAIAPLNAPFDGTEDASDVSIRGNRFIDCHRSGISNQRCVQMIRIIDNYFEGTSDQDIDFEPSAVLVERANRRYQIIGNHFVHSTEPAAVTLGGASGSDPSLDNVFAFNHVMGGAIAVLDSKNLLIIGNTIEGGPTDDNPVLEIIGTAEGLRIVDNTLTRPAGTPAGYILKIGGQGGSFPNGVLVRGNVLRQHVESNGDNCVVLIHNAKAVDFTDNHLVNYYNGTITHGVKVFGDSSSAPVTGVRVSGNTIEGNRGGGAFTYGARATADDPTTTISMISFCHNRFIGCTNWLYFDSNDGGVWANLPVAHGNMGTTGTPFAADTFSSGSGAVITSGNLGDSVELRSAAAPEGAAWSAAPVGSRCFHSGGGAGTTAWIKESGSGNTGWVAL